jgi:AcrR family transcriptional regulator
MLHKRFDRRMDRTRHRLLGVFSDLVRKRHYESITVRDIATGANVSRSTFYEHFSGKDGLLASSITGLCAVLADSLICDDLDRLTGVLEHFRENRALARDILNGPTHVKAGAVLTRQIEIRLQANARKHRGPLLLPTRLAATQLSAMILAPITAWLHAEYRLGSEVLALGLRRTCSAALQALYVRPR